MCDLLEDPPQHGVSDCADMECKHLGLDTQHDMGDGREATHLSLAHGDTLFSACKPGCCWGAGAHRALLSLSLRQLSSAEGVEARNITKNTKPTVRKKGIFSGPACSARLESFVSFFASHAHFFIYLFFIPSFQFFFFTSLPSHPLSIHGNAKAAFRTKKSAKLTAKGKSAISLQAHTLWFLSFVEIKPQNNRVLLLELIIRFSMKEDHKWHYFHQK